MSHNASISVAICNQRSGLHGRGFVAFPGPLASVRTEALRRDVDAALHDAYAATYVSGRSTASAAAPCL